MFRLNLDAHLCLCTNVTFVVTGLPPPYVNVAQEDLDAIRTPEGDMPFTRETEYCIPIEGQNPCAHDVNINTNGEQAENEALEADTAVTSGKVIVNQEKATETERQASLGIGVQTSLRADRETTYGSTDDREQNENAGIASVVEASTETTKDDAATEEAVVKDKRNKTSAETHEYLESTNL